jgi:hypothetical protein
VEVDSMRFIFYAVCLLFVFASSLKAVPIDNHAATQPSPNVQMEKLQILEPTQGRARIIKAGDSFYFMFRVEKLDMPRIEASLVNSICPGERITLSAEGSTPTAIQGNHWVLMLKVPETTKPGVYDLMIDLGVGYQKVANAVKVIDQYKKKFRFVHLSNMNIGDPTSPDFDYRLVEEINLLNPEFIIATGDFIENAGVEHNSESWRLVKKYLSRFNAPSYILCGDQDDPISFPSLINPSLVGTLDYGMLHFFFMMDSSYHPVEQDTAQIKSMITDLTNSKNGQTTFLVGNRDNLGVIDGLTTMGQNPADLFAQGKVRYLLFGGSTDWDFKEYAEKLSSVKVPDLAYVRTAQSSTCMKNGGSGVSQYRVFDVDGDQIRYIYPDEQASATLQHSVPVGRMKILYQGPNDGSQKMQMATVVNALNQSFDNCRLIFRIAGTDPGSVKIANGKIERVIPTGKNELVVSVLVDVPEKGATQVMVTSDPAAMGPYEALPVKISLNTPKKLNFAAAETGPGLNFFASEDKLELTLANTSDRTISVVPQVTLGGQELIIARESLPQSTPPANGDNSSSPTSISNMINLAAGQTVTLLIQPAARYVYPGSHSIVVYLLNDPLRRAKAFGVNVAVANQ